MIPLYVVPNYALGSLCLSILVIDRVDVDVIYFEMGRNWDDFLSGIKKGLD